MDGIIYLILIPSTSEQYIGQTIKDLETRDRQHLADNYTPVEQAMNLLGYESMIVEKCDVSKLSEREAYYIDLFQTNIKFRFGGLNVAIPSIIDIKKRINVPRRVELVYIRCPSCGKKLPASKIVQKGNIWTVDCGCYKSKGKEINSPYDVKYRSLDAFTHLLQNQSKPYTLELAEKLVEIELKSALIQYDYEEDSQGPRERHWSGNEYLNECSVHQAKCNLDKDKAYYIRCLIETYSSIFKEVYHDKIAEYAEKEIERCLQMADIKTRDIPWRHDGTGDIGGQSLAERLSPIIAKLQEVSQ